MEGFEMIYLDNASTTKMFDECVDIHKEFSCNRFFNPSALSGSSLEVSKLIADAEKYFLHRLGARVGNVLFTGCATESNNLAIKGSVRSGDWEYVFSAGEHPSVYNVAKKLELDGYVVHFVPLQKNGQIDVKALEKVLNEKTRLISVMHVNNETGAINDLKKISDLKMKYCPRALLHVDGVQGFMKIPFVLSDTAVDLYSFSGHKFHAPKGIAGLYVKNKNSLKELFNGGGQQYLLRSGTENVSGIMQMKKAVELINEKENFEKVKKLKENFNDALISMGAVKLTENELLTLHDFVGNHENFSGIIINDFHGSPYIENLIFSGVKGETMLHALDSAGVIVGLGSACSSKKAGNRVLEQIGIDKETIISSVRVSFNAYMTTEEIQNAVKIIAECYADIKRRVQ